MLRRIVLVSLTGLLLTMCATGTATAANTPPNRGLLITPIRQFLSADAGKTAKSQVVIANLTSSTLQVNLDVQSFAVSDYTYTYSFATPKPNWIQLSTKTLRLSPGQSQTVPYNFIVPALATPGGHYYTIVASAKLSNGGIDNTVQAASMLYVTINGALSKTSTLVSSSIARFSFGHEVPYSLAVRNTGNIHYFAYITGRLDGILGTPAPVESTHLLLPGAIRNMNGSIPSPVLPGLYKATYGYRTDVGEHRSVSNWVLYVPPWSIAFLLALILLSGGIIRTIRGRRVARQKSAPTSPIE